MFRSPAALDTIVAGYQACCGLSRLVAPALILGLDVSIILASSQ